MAQYIADVAYGETQPLLVVPKATVVAKRDPNSGDIKYLLGQLWLNQLTGLLYFLATKSSGLATWTLLESGGGSGAFSTLSSTGATTLATTGASVNTFGNTTGATSVTISVGTAGFTVDGVASSNYAVGASTTTGTITIGGTAESGTMTLGSSSAANTQIIAGGSGATTLQIANSQLGGSVSIGGAMTTGTIAIGSATSGLVTMPPVSVSAAGTTVVNNVRVGQAVYTGNTDASGATVVYTLTNSFITTTSQLFLTVNNLGANDAQETITRIKLLAGSAQISLKNNGAAALNGNIQISFWVAN